MKKFTTPLFAVLCLFLLTGVAVATEAPEAASVETLDLDLTAQSTSAEDCGQVPTAALDGQEPTFASDSDCGTCSPSSYCVGQDFGAACIGDDGFGNCDIYLGFMCSDGSGLDCFCYGPGGQIP